MHFGDACVVVPATRLFGSFADRFAIGEELIVLSLAFVEDRAFDRAEAIEIFDFNDRCCDPFSIALDMEVNVGVRSEGAFLHISVGDTEIHHQETHFDQIVLCFFGAAEVRFGNDFKQRSTGAIQVDSGVRFAGYLVVKAFSGIFF